MDALLDSIRLAVGEGASHGERHRGARACRALADALDGMIMPGDVPADVESPLAEPPVVLAVAAHPPILPTASSAAPEVAALAPFLASGPLASNPFAGMTADQIFDLAIAKLRGAIGEDGPPDPVGVPFRLTLVPVPRLR